MSNRTMPLALTVIAATLFLGSPADAEYRRYAFPTVENSQNTITLSPSLFHSDFVGEVQVPVTGRWCSSFGFTTRSEFDDDDAIEAATLDFGLRYFLLGGTRAGLSVGVTTSAGIVEASFPIGAERALATRAGAVTTATWVPFGRLVLSVALGGGYEHVSVHSGMRSMGHVGMVPLARAGVGIAF